MLELVDCQLNQTEERILNSQNRRSIKIKTLGNQEYKNIVSPQLSMNTKQKMMLQWPHNVLNANRKISTSLWFFCGVDQPFHILTITILRLS